MHVTLHRAFDMCRDPFRTLQEAISLGIRTILTSGCQPSCLQGIDLLSQLAEKADNRISMGMPGMSEYELLETDSEAVAAVRRLLS